MSAWLPRHGSLSSPSLTSTCNATTFIDINVQRNNVHRHRWRHHRKTPENTENAENSQNRPKVGGSPPDPKMADFGPPGAPRARPGISGNPEFRNFPPGAGAFFPARKVSFFPAPKTPLFGAPRGGLLVSLCSTSPPFWGAGPWRRASRPPGGLRGAKKVYIYLGI
jgi:hypothetical protein